MSFPNPRETIILGIDPGLVKTGWGVIKSQANKISYVSCGVLTTSSSDSMGNRLAKIYNSVMTIIQEFQPIAIAIEQVFVNINPQTSQKLIMARSAALIAITNSEYNAHEYTPNEIKKTITGMGHSSKAQMYTMVKKICNCHLVKDGKTLTSDSIDALAVAITNAFSSH